MIIAKNNIIVKIENTAEPEYAILNPITGSFDIMNAKEYELLLRLEKDIHENQDFEDYVLQRGYVYIDKESEAKAVDTASKVFDDEISNSMVQLMLVPTYSCNFVCTYCFQHGIDGRPTLISKEIVDAFFKYAADNFKGKKQKPFITLFGGEPLINSPAQRKIIEYIVDKCKAEDYELAAVTNGYDFTEFVDILKQVRIKEIQFTIDGSRDVHDKRRATANKKCTFDKIIAGIEAAVNNKMPVNLRSVVDLENIEDLVALAEFLDKRGWLDIPPELFKTQIGRNYELFECYAKPQHLMTQVEIWGKISSMSKKYPILAKLHRPDFKGIRHLVDTGEMYMATFDTCPAAKTEWVFDLHGEIYGCTATCGREEYRLGKFYPEIELEENSIKIWQQRSVKTIPECKECKYDVLCGGGCGVVAANKHDGSILSPDCRPIQQLLEIGINHYIDEIKAMSEDESLAEAEASEEVQCCCETSSTVDSTMIYDNSKESASEKTGCLICGSELVYSKDSSSIKVCSICGKSYEAEAMCVNGHYICDDCHRGNILGIIEQQLIESTEVNPLKLIERIFENSELNMHGPEYHSIVPGVIVAAYQNKQNKRDVSKIKEAIKRGKDTKGGSCGYNGNCGAAVGTGTAVSIIEGATPMSKVERANANMVTGYSLIEISKFGGPRCCKRDSLTSIESFMKITDYFDETTYTDYVCKQYNKNTGCIGVKCTYFPKKM